MSKTYTINEVFYSLQGEGIRAGTPNIFIRFSGCNLKCDIEPGPLSPGGFACDTEFVSGRKMSLEEIYLSCQSLSKDCSSIILTGGEPGLQVDAEFVSYFAGDRGYYLAIETNGTIDLSPVASYLEEDCRSISWVTLSPKVAEHAIKQKWAHELKYVRGYGQAIPKPNAEAMNYLISPAFEGTDLDRKTLEWCIRLCLDNPRWRLSVQQHKAWRVR